MQNATPLIFRTSICLQLHLISNHSHFAGPQPKIVLYTHLNPKSQIFIFLLSNVCVLIQHRITIFFFITRQAMQTLKTRIFVNINYYKCLNRNKYLIILNIIFHIYWNIFIVCSKCTKPPHSK